MKKVLTLFVAVLAVACAPLPQPLPADAAPVMSPFGGRVTSAFGTLTARDWNIVLSESGGDDDQDDD